MKANKRIVNLREQRNWSQRELARRANLNFSVLNRIEQGTRPIRDEELIVFADLFGVTTDELLGRSMEGTRELMGKQVDVSNLTANQQTVLDWALAQPTLSFDNLSGKELSAILDNLSVIFEYEANKKKTRE